MEAQKCVQNQPLHYQKETPTPPIPSLYSQSHKTHKPLTNSFPPKTDQEIKKSLIEKAKLKKEYAKVKARTTADPTTEGGAPAPRSVYDNLHDDDLAQLQQPPQKEPTTERHPDRIALIEATDRSPTPEPRQQQQTEPKFRQRKERKPKIVPFAREHEEAQLRKQEAEERRVAREEAEKQRQVKIEERERFRRAMAKARTGGKNGQRKLGRESKVLLERVKRIVSES